MSIDPTELAPLPDQQTAPGPPPPLAPAAPAPGEPLPDAASRTDEYLPDQPPASTSRFPTEAGSPVPLPLGCLAPGGRVDDFELLAVLGAGSFATVYLARQVSLDRQVALKVSSHRGSEARTLASLEHDHIVHVFSETVSREVRLLCMQYVPGATLEQVLRVLGGRDPGQWSGQAILKAIDALNTHPATFHPAALRDRELLQDADWVEAVCWIGARLAEALDYAHNQGVLHCDIKPANILINPYGRPLLSDFNVAQVCRAVPAGGAGGTTATRPIGGTLSYMAPEHIDAFNPATSTSPDVVDRRSDIYSLGVVLFEMLTGRRPFGGIPPGSGGAQALRRMADTRRTGAPSPRQHRPDVPDVVDRVARRCLDPDPAQRYQTAAELAQALEGCRELRRVDNELPPAGPLTRAVVRCPFVMLIVLILLPHLVASVVNISYNTLRIVRGLTPRQGTAFTQLVLGFNLVVYPICLWLIYRQVIPVYRAWCQLFDPRDAGAARSRRRRQTWRSAPTVFDPRDAGAARSSAPRPAPAGLRSHLAAVRRRALGWPLWVVELSCGAWLLGGVVFPLGLSLMAEPVSVEVAGHFFISFTISGLIALTYAYFGVQFVVLRVLYPRLWLDAWAVRTTACAELAPVARQLRIFPILAGAIPLAGAVLMVGVGPEQFVSSYRTFRLLVTVLIALGMAGFGLAITATSLLTQVITVLTGTQRQPRSASGRRDPCSGSEGRGPEVSLTSVQPTE